MPDSELSIAERLASHVSEGKPLDLIPDRPHELLDEVEMSAWDPDHDVDANQLRDLIRGRTVTDPDPRGVHLRGARIRGRLDLDHISANVQLTLHDCLLEHGLTADAASLPALTLHRCRLRHPTKPALSAAGLRVNASVSLIGSVMDAHTDAGTVRLTGARIGGQLICGRARLTNTDGPALAAVGLHVDDRVFLDEGFRANGTGLKGTIRLSRAHLGQLVLRNATLTNVSGAALSAASMRIDDRIFLDQGFTATGNDVRGTIRLIGTHVGGRLHCLGATVTSNNANDSSQQYRWNLDGLTYTGIPQLDPDGHHRDAWLELLRTATPAYAAQPYQQLAAVFRAEGHDNDVRHILMAQRRDQIHRGALRGPDRWWARITGALLGYGYQPWRALVYLAAVLAVSVTLAVVLGPKGGLAQSPDQQLAATSAPTTAQESPPKPCSNVEMIAKGLDLSTPFLPSPGSSRSGSCETTPSTLGDFLVITRWLLQLAAWALAALFVAGFTGIVRKT